MTYRYHVELTKEFGNLTTSRTYKFEKFSDAFDRFVFEANDKPLDKTFTCWSVVLYDMDLCDVKCKVDSTDFE